MSTTIDEIPYWTRPQAPSPVFAMTVLAHPSPARIGDHCILAPEDAARGIHRSWPAFSGSTCKAALDTRLVSRRPVFLTLRAEAVDITSGDGRAIRVDQQIAPHHAIPLPKARAGLVVALSNQVWLLVRLRYAAPGHAPVLPDMGIEGPALADLRASVALLAPTDHPVLLRGETGTGKERVAHALHRCSARAHKPFVAINLAALSPDTVVAQLFGHSRGAFTGAVGASGGAFGQAKGGTLFLDEVGEASVDIQAALLRALDTGEVQPLGGPPVVCDVRVVAATDANLEAQQSAGRFRAAFFHRLSGHTIWLPPLRERIEDIPALLLVFLRQELGEDAPRLLDSPPDQPGWLEPQTIQALLDWHWPGNVRELRSVAQWMAVHCRTRSLSTLPPAMYRPASARGTPESDDARIIAALADHDYRVDPAAQALQMARNTLRAHMNRLGIRRAVDLSAEDIEAARAQHADDVVDMARALRVGVHALKVRISSIEAGKAGA